MFRKKEWLVEQGLYDKTRADCCYIIGMIYDDIITNKKIISKQMQDKIKELREYLHSHRELIGNKDYPIVKEATVIARMIESFQFKLETEKVKQIKQKPNSWDKHSGIYGIYLDDELVYIGSTTCFKDRFNTHRNNLMKHSNDLYLYKQLSKYIDLEEYSISFKILIDLQDNQESHLFTEKEMKAMEYALINYLQPKYNVAGRLKPFYNK